MTTRWNFQPPYDDDHYCSRAAADRAAAYASDKYEQQLDRQHESRVIYGHIPELPEAAVGNTSSVNTGDAAQGTTVQQLKETS